ncbi:MAG: aminoglycoside phosphotransferase family protein [Phycisphaerales bacterium]
MLSQADANVVRRDPQLPGLAVLLDPDAFGDVLRNLSPETQIEWVRPQYVRYKAGTSCLVGYVVRASGTEIDVYARCHRSNQPVKLDKASQRQSVPGPLGTGIEVVPELALAVFVFPNDHEVRALRRLLDPRRSLRTLKRLLPGRPALWKGSLRPLRYKPERRCVAQLSLGAEARAVTKIYTASGYDIARCNARAFIDQSPLQVARVIGDSARYCALTWEWIEGHGLYEVLRDSSTPQETLDRTSAALVHLHHQKPNLRTTYTSTDYDEALHRAAGEIETIYPELGPRARRLCQSLTKLLLEHPWRSQAIHGDFSADQVILAGENAAILDFDRAGYGDPCIDLGTFGAKLIGAAIDGQLPIDRAEAGRHGLVSAYGKSTGAGEASGAELFTAGALLQLAQEPFRNRWDDWPDKTEALLACAERTTRVGSLADRTTCSP